MANTSILAAFERMWQHVTNALGKKSDISHNHDDVYYTKTETDAKVSSLTSLPSVATSDNGKFLRVVNGKWAAQSIPSAEEATF